MDDDLTDLDSDLPADVYVARLQKGHYANLFTNPIDEETERDRQLLIDFQNINQQKEM